MATVAYLSDNHVTNPEENPRAFGTISDGWVVPDTSVLISDVTSAIADGPHNAFNHASTSGLDVTIDTGEAMVSGSPIGKDTTTVVTLAASTPNQTVYAGFEPLSQDTVVIGIDSDFSSAAHRIPLWGFNTDATTVTDSIDRRDLDAYVNIPNTRYETSDGSGTAVDNASELNGVGAANYARTDQSTTFDAGIDIATTAAHLSLIDTDNADKQWVIESNDGNVLFLEDGSASRFRVDSGGGVHMFAGQAVGMRIENRASRPPGTSTGRIIYRADKE